MLNVKFSKNKLNTNFVKKSGDTITGNLIANKSNVGLYGVDSLGNQYPFIIDNGTNLWIGARIAASSHRSGKTQISAGYDFTNKKGNPSISVSVVNDTNTGSTSYDVYHKGNLTTATTAAAGLVKLDSTVTKYLSGGGWKYPVTFSRVIAEKDNISIAANTASEQTISYTVPTGMTVLGVVGYLVGMASSSGANPSFCNVSYVGASNTNAGKADITLRNFSASAAKIRLTITVLCYRIN